MSDDFWTTVRAQLEELKIGGRTDQLMTAPGLPDWLEQQVRDALEGESNDAEHDALAAVADHFCVEYTTPEMRSIMEEGKAT